MTESTRDSELSLHVRRVRLRAELALVRRLNAGFGFADARIPSETFLRDDAARTRIGAGSLRPQNTHAKQHAQATALLHQIEAELARQSTRLTSLGERFDLGTAERAVLEIAVAYAVDSDVAALCHSLSAGRPIGLHPDICRDLHPTLTSPSAWHSSLHPRGLLIRGGLIVVGANGIVAHRRIVDWLLDDDRISDAMAPAIRILEPCHDLGVVLPDSVTARADAVAQLVDATPPPFILVQGAQGSGKLAVAHRIARRLERRLVVAPLSDLRELAEIERVQDPVSRVVAEARLRDAVLYIPGAEALAGNDDARHIDRAAIDALDGFNGVCVLGTRALSSLSLPLPRPFNTVRIVAPSLETRRAAWESVLGANVEDADAGVFAARYVIGPGAISEVVRDASAFAAATDRPIRSADIEASVRRRLSLNLGPFATRITRRARFDEMVLPSDVVTPLRDMIAMVRERSRILETWGYADHLGLGRGVTALFSGEPGTGKTMAASVISSELGLELFRIDLAAVVSKWVGETEKHLARIFDEAQSAEAMLLFDEADSLFGKRTDVKSSTDRYANLEVNYILQRMETFDGVSVLTSNNDSAIDQAFMRRLNFRVRFPEPDAGEREALWRLLLPPETGLADGVDFGALAERFEMTGGHIKNAIVRAAVVAARDGRDMAPEDLVEGAQTESHELGKVISTL